MSLAYSARKYNSRGVNNVINHKQNKYNFSGASASRTSSISILQNWLWNCWEWLKCASQNLWYRWLEFKHFALVMGSFGWYTLYSVSIAQCTQFRLMQFLFYSSIWNALRWFLLLLLFMLCCHLFANSIFEFGQLWRWKQIWKHWRTRQGIKRRGVFSDLQFPSVLRRLLCVGSFLCMFVWSEYIHHKQIQ